MASVTMRNIRKVYDNTVEVIKGVDLDVKDGEFMVFVGPSGCGKSTMMRMIAGLEDITDGELLIGDRVANDLPPVDRGVAMVFQSYALYPHMTVAENMGFGLKLAGSSKAEIAEIVGKAAEILHITNLLDRRPKALSGGQRQRVAIGRAIVRKPGVFLFDEPLSNLDANLRVQMRVELTKLHKAADYFRGVKTQLVKDFGLNDNIPIDPKVLTFQIPGGMLSNLLNQMKEMGSADKYPELLEEMPRVRAELGYPPLVTPTSQIVGSMAALNVTLGRYKMIPNEVKDLVRGKYGRTPAPIDPEVKKLAIGDEPQIDHRPADDIAPQMESLKAKLAAAGYPNADIDDVLSYALFPDVALAYFKKHR